MLAFPRRAHIRKSHSSVMETITSLDALVRATSRGTRSERITLSQVECIAIKFDFMRVERATALSSALERSAFPQLKRIDLHGNWCGASGAKAIASALKRGSFPALEFIGLGWNLIGDEGVKRLASALRRGAFPRLAQIALYHHGIRTEGAKALAAALERSTLPMLEDVNFDTNHIPKEVLRRVRRAVACARQRGRMLLLLGAESARCESPAKHFLTRDGDRAVMCRTLGFMLPA